MDTKKRGGYLGAITKIEQCVDALVADDDEDIPTTKIALEKMQLKLTTTRDKFEAIQKEFIEQSDAAPKREREEETLKTVLDRCAKVLEKIEMLKEALFEDTPDETSMHNMSYVLKNTLEEQNRKHREEMDKIISKYQKDSPTIEQKHTENPSESSEMAQILKMLAQSSSQQIELMKKMASSSSIQSSNTNLPQFNLPSFSGKVGEWPAFRDQFASSIIKHPNLADNQKLQYLKTSLIGDAAAYISHLANTDVNFDVAWQILEERFDRKYNIVSDHVQTFKTLPNCKSMEFQAFNSLCLTVSKAVKAVRAINVNQFDAWAIDDVLQHLDDATRLKWVSECKGNVPNWDTFEKFLFNKLKDMESVGIKPVTSQPKQEKFNNKFSKSKATALVAANNTPSCKCCKNDSHQLFKCPKFLAQSPNDRFQTVKELKLCRKCISSNHMTSNCNFRPCSKCKLNHNVLLHDSFVAHASSLAHAASVPTASTSSAVLQPSAPVFTPAEQSPVLNAITQPLVNVTASPAPRVFLATAMVDVVGLNGNRISCRAILDCGAQRNIMSINLQRQLKLPRRQSNFSILGVGGVPTAISCVTEAVVHSKVSSDFYNLEFIVVPKITGDLPNWPASPHSLPIPSGISLADPEWYVQKPVDLLLGSEIYWDIERDGAIHLGQGLPKLKPSSLGYLIVGKLEPPKFMCNLVTAENPDENLDRAMARFFDIEDIPDEEPVTDEHRAAEEHFVSTHTRTLEGRFVVKLPFKKDIEGKTPLLGISRPTAVRQLLALERRFAKNFVMKTLYVEVIRDYLAKGWLELVPDRDINNYSYYMPHHGVLKDSTTTRLRIVYNASSKTSNGLSLNDILLAGPTVHPDLFTVLVRFRKFEFAVTADISKMYLQLKLHPNDVDFQRLVWRENPREQIRDYRIPVVFFGGKASPFLATRALVQLADEHKETHPLASAAIRENSYVDDFLYSAETWAEAQEIQTQLVDVLSRGGFEPSKWTTNHPDYCTESALEVQQEKTTVFRPQESEKTLGLKWDAATDTFQFVSPIDPSENQHTKREIASAIARIFDPLGLIGPAVIVAKVLLQELHKTKTGWDSKVSAESLKRWTSFVQGLCAISILRIPRWIAQKSALVLAELHGFCDASTKAYGASVYFVAQNEGGHTRSTLVVSKSRVAPIKTQTIPRLELCGAVLLISLMEKVKSLISPNEIHLWTDSTIVLAWLNSPPDAYKIFVANRVRKVLAASNSHQWKHIPTHLNPADVLSRGATPAQLLNTDLWWSGPQFLTQARSSWPQPPDGCYITMEESMQIFLPIEMIEDSFFNYLMKTFSSLQRIQTKMAYVMRFPYNIRNPHAKRVGLLSTEELQEALRKLIYLDQLHAMPEVFHCLQRGKPFSGPWKSLESLTPFLDKEGAIRVGGRIQKAHEPWGTRHQILLPTTQLQEMIARREHWLQLHAGPSLLLALLRQRYWPVSGRNLTRKIFRNCVKCVRLRPKPLDQLMGNLPEHRVTFVRPFYATGVDYAGPVFYKTSKLRNAKPAKGYICIFVCLATKAVHLEFVSELTTAAFLAVFKRLIGRKPTPKHMHSDRGSNFVGAKNELAQLYSNYQSLVKNTADSGVVWHFNPPGAPHQGGLWEAGVKSVKFHLKRVLGQTLHTFEEITTILCQIEGLLNSRPLCPLSDDPGESDYLTPGRFLGLEPLNDLPEADVGEIPDNRLTRWEICDKRHQQFAERWRKEYLNTLTQRRKWTRAKPNLKKGDIVVTLDDPSSKWVLGRIEDVHFGPDKLVRVIHVRTSKGVYTRPITKVALLPVDQILLASVPAAQPGEDVDATTGGA